MNAQLSHMHRHMKSLWPSYTFLPPLPFMAWTSAWFARGIFRWEHVALFFLAPALAYASKASRRLYVGLFPMACLGLIYDAMRFMGRSASSANAIHVCDLRAIEMRWFGLTMNGGRETIHDVFQTHNWPVVDILAAVPYGTFIFASLGFALFMYKRDFTGLLRFSWSFLVCNLIAFATYRLYPAAPPWYFHAHGCAVDVTTAASEGPALARVDGWLGFPYFHGMYARSSNVFGAVPSMHVAYPALIAMEGYAVFTPIGRVASGGYLLLMVFAAVYLDHHWVVDVLLGLLYAVVVYASVRFVVARIVPPHKAVLRVIETTHGEASL